MMKSVSTRLLAVMLAITVVGMGLIAVIGTAMAAKAILELSRGRLDEATGRNAEGINGWMKEQIHYVDAVAADFESADDISPEALLPALFADESDLRLFRERHGQAQAIKGELATYKGRAFLGVDAGSTMSGVIFPGAYERYARVQAK